MWKGEFVGLLRVGVVVVVGWIVELGWNWVWGVEGG